MLTWILLIQNLFHDLTNIYAWNKYISPKATKFRKFVTRATDHKTRMWKYRGEACDASYVTTPLHAPYDDRSRQWWLHKLSVCTWLEYCKKNCAQISFIRINEKQYLIINNKIKLDNHIKLKGQQISLKKTLTLRVKLSNFTNLNYLAQRINYKYLIEIKMKIIL